jgi:hypothetical protein
MPAMKLDPCQVENALEAAGALSIPLWVPTHHVRSAEQTLSARLLTHSPCWPAEAHVANRVASPAPRAFAAGNNYQGQAWSPFTPRDLELQKGSEALALGGAYCGVHSRNLHVDNQHPRHFPRHDRATKRATKNKRELPPGKP